MIKCGKVGSCIYNTTAGCTYPFNCQHQIIGNAIIMTTTNTPLSPVSEIYKDNKIARLTAENERLSKQLTDGKCVYLSDSGTAEGCVQSPCPNYKTVEDILKENAELKARLGKAVVLPCVDKGDWYYTVKFPARVEDEIFIINKETNSILSAAVNNIVSYDESGKEWIFSIRYDCEGCDKYGECDYFDCPSKNCIWGDMDIPHGDNEYFVGYTGVNLSDYNKNWFTDRAKAEARLAELKGGKQ